MARLNWSSFKSIVPVAPSLRREHWDLFSRLGLPENRRNEDEAFYDALLHGVRNDPDFRKDFELRFLSSKKKKDREKSFVHRSLAWLQRGYPELCDYVDRWNSVPAGAFPEHTPAGELWQLVLRTMGDIREERDQVAVSAEEVWKLTRTTLLETLQGIESPSLAGIAAIEEAAAVFLEAGAVWKKAAAETERQRGAVRELLREMGDRPGVARVLDQLETLDPVRVARLHDEAGEARGLLTGLQERGKRIAEKTASFDRQRRDGASWTELAPQAAALATLEDERKKAEEGLTVVSGRMESVLSVPTPDNGRPAPEADSAARGEADEGAPAPDAPAPAMVHENAAGETEIPLPATWNDVSAWCGEHLKGRLALSPRARNSVKKALYQDVATVARCLLWLAGAYRRSRIEGCGEGVQGAVAGIPGVHNERCGGDAFEFAWAGRRPVADWHLRSGGNSRDPARCLRIYYCWDDVSGTVLVGDMPGHVRSRAT